MVQQAEPLLCHYADLQKVEGMGKWKDEPEVKGG